MRRGVLLFAYFLLHKQEKVGRRKAKTFSRKHKKKLADVKSAYSSGNPSSFNCCFSFFRLSSENLSAIGPLHAASGVSAPRLR